MKKNEINIKYRKMNKQTFWNTPYSLSALLSLDPVDVLGCGLTIIIRSSEAITLPPGSDGANGLTGVFGGSSSPSERRWITFF